MNTRRIALRSLANGKYVCADLNLENPPRLIANRDSVQGAYEEFELVFLDEPNGVVAPAPAPPGPTPPPLPPAPGIPSALPGGGVRFHASDTSVRGRPSHRDIQRFLPSIGPFTFPAPWNTQAVRLTNEQHGRVAPIGMSYWRNISNDPASPELYVFLSLDERITIIAVNKRTLESYIWQRLPYAHTGESCYWGERSDDGQHELYIPDGRRLLRHNVVTGEAETVFEAPSLIWQCHSSADGRVHSMTVDNGPAVFFEKTGQLTRFQGYGVYDECQVDESGRWLLIKETNVRDGQGRLENLIVDLVSGEKFRIRDEDGAVGHSDMGDRFIVGEDDQWNKPAMRLWVLATVGPVSPGVVYYWPDWDGMTRYVSVASIPRIGLFSSAHAQDLARANELVAVRLDGSQQCVAVCPGLADLHAEDGVDAYWRVPRANLDTTGEWAVWTANAGSNRQDAFLVRVPQP